MNLQLEDEIQIILEMPPEKVDSGVEKGHVKFLQLYVHHFILNEIYHYLLEIPKSPKYFNSEEITE